MCETLYVMKPITGQLHVVRTISYRKAPENARSMRHFVL